ncbi:DNA polymerase III subunit epsilon [Aeromonas dhakensis]|uniref:exonuclease domain-containing protein n=1 Tax=Aeromonas TaxID=642 RepID=UPI001118509C|nr:exonuclease domain-containing protein [Aeromonas dhakensis]TNI58895.1 DNA polymerase III subunit epsilon [Aeromonas dhakensis]
MTPQQQASSWLLNCHILDTETTGLDSQAEIVEISIIDELGQVVLDTLVKPLKPIPADATAIHGITNNMVASAPSWAEIHDDVCRIVSSKPLVIYNADYDMCLMAQTATLFGLNPVTADTGVHCAMLAYAEFYGDWNNFKGSYRWQRLTNAAQQQGVVIEGQAHRSLADVRMTLGVIKAMATKIADDDVCDHCGTPGCDGTTICQHCGDRIACDDQFCPRCTSGAI